MIKLTLPVENPQIEINGKVFDLQLSDTEIISKANDLQKQLSKYADKPASDFGVDEILSDCEAARAFLDEMLGEGATKKLSKGRPVRLQLMIRWITAVAEGVSAAYADTVVGA